MAVFLNPVDEYSADQYCKLCQSIFSQPNSFYQLVETDEGLAHHSLDDLERFCQQGCPFCKFIVTRMWPLETLRQAGVQGLVLDIGSHGLQSLPQDYGIGRSVDCLRVFCKYDSGRLRQVSSIHLGVSIDDPAAQEVSSRPVQRDPTQESFYRTAQGWLQNCLRNHVDCGKKSDSILPTRVLHVGDNSANPHLYLYHSSKNERGRYTALSYCWGKAQSVVTTTHNVQDYSHSISLDSLHQSVRDAVIVTQKLNIPYLWVDALCILQDNAEDKAQEIASMGDIYQNAILTIIASRANNVDEGFLKPSEPLDEDIRSAGRYSFPYYCKNGRTGKIWLETSYSESHPQPLYERGWVLQEEVLCQRALVFEPSRVAWQCFLPKHRLRANMPRVLLAASDLPLDNDKSDGSLSLQEQADSQSEVWESLIEVYSLRKLTCPEDKLPAIGGVARQLNRKWNDVYVVGLWQSVIIRQLGWQVREHATSGVKARDGNKDDLSLVRVRPPAPGAKHRAPTWSWASIDKGINYYYGVESFIADAEFLGSNIVPLTQADPMGQVRSAEIFVRAASISSQDVVLTDPEWQWTWKLDDGSRTLENATVATECVTLLLLGYNVLNWSSGRNLQVGEFEKRRAGLILTPVNDVEFQRVGVFDVTGPEELEGSSNAFPCKIGCRAHRQNFTIV